MHRMQSDSWPYSKSGRESSKVPSLHTAVLCAAVFCPKVVHNRRQVLSVRNCHGFGWLLTCDNEHLCCLLHVYTCKEFGILQTCTF